jgi:hypothetical protein
MDAIGNPNKHGSFINSNRKKKLICPNILFISSSVPKTLLNIAQELILFL